MNKILIIITLFCSLISFGQTQKIRAYLDDKQFYAPGIGDYVEIQLQFVGYSIKYKGQDNGLISEVAVRMAIKKGDSIVAKDAYRLQSPLMKDSIIEDFYDLRRFVLNPGVYSLEIELDDLNAVGESVKASKPIVVENNSKNIYISDIQIAESVTKGDNSSMFFKSGYNIIPRISTFYPTEISTLPVYFEIYNSLQLKDSVFAIKQTITNVMTGKEMTDFTQSTRHKSNEVVPIIRAIDITDLYTGKYTLDIAVLSRDLNEITKKTYEFERSNDAQLSADQSTLLVDPAFQASITDDSLAYYLASLIPISRSVEIKSILTLLKSKDKELARKHIQGYWIITAGSGYYEAWMKYKNQVHVVEELYSNNFQAGYETDRGRVYLQYGAPTTAIQKDVSSNEYPYEIWQYNKIGKFSNKRFIFYNPDLVNNGYRLLHSDMIGELKNPSWQLVLNKRNTNNGTIDDPNQNVQSTFGGNSNSNFKQY